MYVSNEQIQKGLDQLANEYKNSAGYGPLQINLVRKVVGQLSPRRFDAVIEHLAGVCRYLPTVEDFRIAIAKVKYEPQREQEKRREKFEAKQFFTYPPEDRRNICRAIRNRLSGNMSDQEWKSFRDTI